MNLYDLVLSGQNPSQQQALAMADFLRKREARATLAMMTGDPIAQNFAKSIQQHNQKVLEQIATQRQNIATNNLAEAKLKVQQAIHESTMQNQRWLRQVIEEGKNSRQEDTQEHEVIQAAVAHARELQKQKIGYGQALEILGREHGYDTALEALKHLQRMREDERNNEFTAGQNRLGREATAKEKARDRAADAAKWQLEQAEAAQKQKVEDYQEMQQKLRDGGHNAVGLQMDKLDELLSSYLDDRGRVTRNIPGIGYGFPSKINDFAARTLSSEEGKRIFSAMHDFRNTYLKTMSGATVTGSEFDRFENALLSGFGVTDQDLINAYHSLRDRLREQAQIIKDSYGNPPPPPDLGGQSGNNASFPGIPDDMAQIIYANYPGISDKDAQTVAEMIKAGRLRIE